MKKGLPIIGMYMVFILLYLLFPFVRGHRLDEWMKPQCAYQNSSAASYFRFYTQVDLGKVYNSPPYSFSQAMYSTCAGSWCMASFGEIKKGDLLVFMVSSEIEQAPPTINTSCSKWVPDESSLSVWTGHSVADGDYGSCAVYASFEKSSMVFISVYGFVKDKQ